jgi:small subunit ribosomal protein S17
MPKKVFQGVVMGDSMSKTRRVEITRRVMHPVYGKYLRRKTVCSVHDEEDASHRGDIVEIVECRPISKTKRWQLVRVIEESKFREVTRKRASEEEAEVKEVIDIPEKAKQSE